MKTPKALNKTRGPAELFGLLQILPSESSSWWKLILFQKCKNSGTILSGSVRKTYMHTRTISLLFMLGLKIWNDDFSMLEAGYQYPWTVPLRAWWLPVESHRLVYWQACVGDEDWFLSVFCSWKAEALHFHDFLLSGSGMPIRTRTVFFEEDSSPRSNFWILGGCLMFGHMMSFDMTGDSTGRNGALHD